MPFNDLNKQKKYFKLYYQKHKEQIKQRAYQYRQGYTKQAKQQIYELKINGCAICGYNKCVDSLEFHHVNPDDKLFQISGGNIYRKIDVILDEIQKCILLCSNCHKEIGSNPISRMKIMISI